MGHEVGDKVLVAVAKRLKRTLRAADIIDYVTDKYGSTQHNLARLGGDEFTILLRGIKSRDDTERVAQRIHLAFNDRFNIAGKELTIGVSIGIAIAGESGESATELLKCADIAMYDAKMQGKNTYRFFSSEIQNRVMEQTSLEDALRKAINNDEFSLHYQPQIDAVSGRVIGLEALINEYGMDKLVDTIARISESKKD